MLSTKYIGMDVHRRPGLSDQQIGRYVRDAWAITTG
jgi:hypothetical protein